MNGEKLIFLYLLGLVAQCLLGVHTYFTPYMLLSILPGLLMCLPLERGTVSGIFIAFLSGLVVDFFTDGMLGLSSCALMPVALMRLSLYRLFGGEELFTRADGSPTAHLSPGVSFLCILIASFVFFAIYVWADGAGMRPIQFNALRVVCSAFGSAALSTILARFIFVEKDQRWK